MTRSRAILVIEDDRTLNRLLCEHLTDMGHAPRGVASRAEALALLAGFAPDLALLDVRLPDCDGLRFLPDLRHYCPVIVLTAFGSVGQAVGAVKTGASDYLVKPVTRGNLELALDRAFETVALRRDVALWQAQAQRDGRVQMVGDSDAMTRLRDMVGLLAASDAPVLIQGEGGTGKGVTAAAIHATGPRANSRFVTVDCDPAMQESELFGKVREARQIDGLMAAADHGTLFLNEVDKLSGPMQGRLLRMLEQSSYRRHGGTAEISCDIRVIAATALDLQAEAQAGRFRTQLYYRLAGFTLFVPPLRDRREDIAPMAEFLLDNRSFQRGLPKRFDPQALAALRAHDWPGNIRELANAVDRGVMLSAGQGVIGAAHLGLGQGAAPGAEGAGLSLHFDDLPTLDALRDAYIARLMTRLDGNRQRMAQTLGISERNLYRLLKSAATKERRDR